MKPKGWLVLIFFAAIALLLGFRQAVGAQAGLDGQETPLNPAGEAYEINPDNQGFLWISDFKANEIRRVNPTDGSHTAYQIVGSPTDARADDAGNLWWVDATFNLVGRMPVAGGNASLWEIPGSSGLYGTALGANNDIWVTDFVAPYLYHLSPGASEVCTYTLPLDGVSDYLLVDENQVWLGDNINAQIDRLNVISDTFNTWSLPVGNRPTGLALDGQGNLWWANTDQGELARLTPNTNQVITYKQATLQSPTMLALDGGRVWYTDQGRFGVLDPSHAEGQTTTAPTANPAAVKKCSTLGQTITTPIVTSTGQADWTDVTYPALSSASGWYVFQLPQGGLSWGIAAQGDYIWLVDQGRQVLAKVSKEVESKVYLPLISR